MRHTRSQAQLLRDRTAEWAARIRSWPVTETYVYFNNDWEGFAPRNARRLRRLLEYAGSD